MKSDQQNHQPQPKQQDQAWQFTFFGETPPRKLPQKHHHKAPRKSTDGSCFPLRMATMGQCLWIVNLEDREGNDYLKSIGLIPGTELTVVSCTPGGSVIVVVQNQHIGLNATMAQNILVSTEPFCLQ